MSTNLTLPAAVVTSIALFLAYRLNQNRQHDIDILEITTSPLKKALDLPTESLIYGPNLLPGGRNVNTPYGTLRAYEFGPIDGPKVLFVHGISTACFALKEFAEHLAKKGCRVLLFDLYGRGYSDNPTNIAHSSQLYVTGILSVLASSPISWMGDDAFRLIGYSMGGGIAMAFADLYPHLIKSLVLLCPAGLIRDKHLAWPKYMMYQFQGLIPLAIFERILKRRLENPPKNLKSSEDLESIVTDQITEEIGTNNLKGLKVLNQVKEQVANHKGFVNAFTSSVRHAPLSGQNRIWARIGSRLDLQRKLPTDKEARRNGFLGGKIVVFLGEDDAVILSRELKPDIVATVGGDNLEIIVFKVGHDLPVVIPETAANRLWNSWTKLGVV